MDDLLSEFLTETAESIDVIDVELVTLESDPGNREILDRIFRLVHTIKGTCGFLGLPRLESVAHASETLLGKFRDGDLTVTPAAVTLILESLDTIKDILAHLGANHVEPEGDDAGLRERLERAAAGEAIVTAGGGAAAQSQAASDGAREDSTEADLDAQPDESVEDTPDAGQVPAAAPPQAPRKGEAVLANQSIRVNVEVLENLMTMVSELVLTRNQLLEMVRHLEDSEFKVPLQRLSSVTAELQESVMKTRMQPIGNAWSKLPRIVRDLSHELGKKIELQMKGAETELDRQVLELIKDPLTHMVRNSADHGLEMPADRKAAGKPETGTITLRAFHEGGHIIIEVSDDGRGLNTDKIRQKVLAQDLATEAALEGMSENQIHRFIFHPGFSTAAEVTSVSGRGVGMDVVRTNIEQIGGAIDLKSRAGQGMALTIKIPLTLAIVSALIVKAGPSRFAIPQLAVVELVRVAPGSEYQVETIHGAPVVRLRDNLLPLMYLSEILGMEATGEIRNPEEAFIVVTQVGARIFGIIVDEVFDTEEIVVKPVASCLRDIPVFSGNTILGDGSVIMIIDPNGLAEGVAQEAEGETMDQPHTDEERDNVVRLDDQADRTALLVVRAGDEEPKAVPLSLVTRLEEVDAARIEYSNGRYVVQYRGRLMPLMHAVPGQALLAEGRQPVLVFTEGERAMGLAVDEIVDIVEERLDIELKPELAGTLGTAVVRGKATEVLDVGHYLTQANAEWFDAESVLSDTGPTRVLVVDDSAFFRNIIVPSLKAEGLDVVAVASGREALALREDGDIFDVIVSDIEMPETDGLTLAKAVREDQRWAETPLIAVSGHSAPRDVARGLEAGFDAYLPKADRARLVSAIAELTQTQEEAA